MYTHPSFRKRMGKWLKSHVKRKLKLRKKALLSFQISNTTGISVFLLDNALQWRMTSFLASVDP